MKKLTLILLLVLFFAGAALAKININTASVEELESLSGIGPAKAEAVLKYRKEMGKFKTEKDLVKVKGIGDKLYQKIKDEITVGK
ncbi:ComEA family DNA-binding protein [Desulfogranum mediterraneum]|uniref:ComEA family DNA-binding protein n=1 Tax=Desulfogranum mediterraneum TaxID=160661 RepID=UPI00048F14E3|nr:helix-hairpin-helix domain-containing protein [Desulfogranum mediterraneum]